MSPARSSPVLRFVLVAAVVVAGGVALAAYLRIHPLFGALAGVNVATILLYGYDKAVAGTGRLRVPENVLHLLALFGGSPAALLGQTVFRHKTVKTSFRRVYWLIVVLQLGVITAAAWFWRRP
jgi:uncharacterized membrane protein YsdA (DUF1294 family)